MPANIQVYPDINSLAASAASMIINESREAIGHSGRFSISLSGGSTPRTLYSLLAQPPLVAQIDWSRTHIFWGDERCVPPDHPDSDYLMARESLLDHLTLDNMPHIYRLEGELPPEQSAQRYEAQLRNFFGSNPSNSFDVLLLGMGEDGHTASLFPGTSPIHEKDHCVIGHYVQKLNSWRLTLTPPILNKSKLILFMAAGNNKSSVLKQVLRGPYQPDLFPSQIIHPESGQLIWLVDSSAASELGG